MFSQQLALSRLYGQQDRQQGAADSMALSEIGRRRDQIKALQALPAGQMPEEVRQAQIDELQRGIAKLYTPAIGKKEAAKFLQSIGVSPSAEPITGTVPAEQPLTLGGGELPAINLPGKGPTQVSRPPVTQAEALSGTPTPNPFIQASGQLAQVGFTPEEIDKRNRIAAGIAPKPVLFRPYKQSDYENFRTSYAQSLGLIDPSQMNSDQNLAARREWMQRNNDPKLGSFEQFVDSAAKAAGLQDAKDLTPESLLALRHAYMAAGVTDHISQGHYFYKNDLTGEVVDVPITRRTLAPTIQMPQIGARPQAQPAPTAPVNPQAAPAVTPQAGAPTAPIARPPSPQTTPHQARQKVAAMTGQAAPASGGPGTVIGHVASISDKAALKGAEKATDTVRPMVNIDQTMGQYIQQVQKNPQAATPRQDLALIVSAVRAMNPGTVRLPQTELALEIKAGSWGDRFRRQYEIATNGTLPPDQRQDLYRIVHHETSVSAANAARELQASKGQIPPWMNPYMAEQANPDETVRFTVDGAPTIYPGTRQQMQSVIDAGYKVVRVY